MIKILHCADLHLDSPFAGKTAEQAAFLRSVQLSLPGQLAKTCREENCDLVLISGDLFDGPASREALEALNRGFSGMGVPVFISPGNHDFYGPDSPWDRMIWPENVYIFTEPAMTSRVLPELDCRIYGAGYRSMDCPPLLEGFHTEGQERFHIALLHGDPTRADSPYCPVTRMQVEDSALDYLALGHIHKGGAFRAGSTLCAWPGCAMGRGYDEEGVKGVLLVTLEDSVEAKFVPLAVPEFYDIRVPAAGDPRSAAASLLPPVGNRNFYRITLTGESPDWDPETVRQAFPEFPNLVIRDETVPQVDIWQALDRDNLEGEYFRRLRSAMEGQDEAARNCIELAARISRLLLDGQEVDLS